MIRINLLPYRAERKKENIRVQVYMFLAGLFALLIVLYLVNNSMANKIDRLTKEIADKKKKVAMFNKRAQEVEVMRKELELLQKKMEVIDRLNTNRDEAFLVTKTIMDCLVEKRMWFTRLDIREELPGKKKRRKAKAKRHSAQGQEDKLAAKPLNIRITGVALDNTTVADFMTRLTESKMFTNVQLVTLILNRLEEKNINLKNFEVICQKVVTPSSKPETESAQKTDKSKTKKSKTG